MKSSLEDILYRCPYNSFGKIMLSAGETYPQSYGGNCVFQCRELTASLVQSALSESNVSYVTAEEKPHWVVFVNDGDEYMLDPFLLCPEPINITKVLRGESQVFDTYPKGVNKIEAKLVTEQTIQVSLFTKKEMGASNKYSLIPMICQRAAQENFRQIIINS